jgi:hypothetical protein
MKYPKNIFLSTNKFNFTVICFFVLFTVNTLYLDQTPLIWMKPKHCNLLEQNILQKVTFLQFKINIFWDFFNIGSSSYNQAVTFKKIMNFLSWFFQNWWGLFQKYFEVIFALLLQKHCHHFNWKGWNKNFLVCWLSYEGFCPLTSLN